MALDRAGIRGTMLCLWLRSFFYDGPFAAPDFAAQSNLALDTS